jgi:hypothetical protein
MDGLAKIDRDELIRRMRQDFEKTMREVADAVNDAPDGHLIDGSEERVRDLLSEFRQKSFRTAAQMRVEATEASAAFSPEAARSDQSGLAVRSMLSCNGRVELRRRRFENPQGPAGGVQTVIDDLIDLVGSGVAAPTSDIKR